MADELVQDRQHAVPLLRAIGGVWVASCGCGWSQWHESDLAAAMAADEHEKGGE